MLTAGELEEMRRTEVDALPDRAARATRSTTSNNRGGRTTGVAAAPWAWPAWLSEHLDAEDGTLPARLARPDETTLQLAAERYGTTEVSVVTLPALTPVNPGDQLTITGEAGTTVVEVVGELTGSRSWQTSTKVMTTRADLAGDRT